MGFFNKIAKPAGIAAGATVLASILFPETMGGLTNGFLGATPVGTAADGSTMFAPGSTNLFGFDVGSGAAAGAAGASKGFFSDPGVLSASILAGTSLISGLFGTDYNKENLDLQKQHEAAQEQLAQQQLALDKDKLAQALEIAKIQAGAAGAAANAQVAAANLARKTNLQLARSSAIGQGTQLKLNAMELPIEARNKQATAAQNTGTQSGFFFNQLIPNLQRPAIAAGG